MLPRIGVYAAMLAAAGVPLYIHLPRFVTVEMGLSLGTLGAVLLGIRIMDFAQDPALGWLTDRPGVPVGTWAGVGAIGLAAGFWGLFGMAPLGAPVVWLVGVLMVIFTSYSLLTILFYAQGVRLVAAGGSGAHFRLAGAREAGTVVGILLAAILPTALGYQGFAFVYLGLVVLATFAMARLWSRGSANPTQGMGLRAILSHARMRFLLALGLVNAMPVAVTSTLFLFFVEDRLGLTGQAGPFLLLFFACAGLSAPLWARAARRWGARQVLLVGMSLAIISFFGVVMLGPGAAAGFALVCFGSGLALGADMVLLPALFAVALDEEELEGGAGFGLWSLVTKMSLALVAALVLPLLDWAGFQPGIENDAEALWALTLGYAVLPCILKVAAVALVLALPREARET
ncbi:MFS transporter [Shimia abyssi]|uniref:Na+/melibiose symporter-like transporter n=1 Tax=Shimia abyssi TaxID=1662395 RepID=A0A2P8FEU5_9RHOB|nr:MFS transporter [Shimia abyssi]PSL20229.1 Na+/melibiose symporter-like transporter [Shimia abyssi]